MSSRYLRVFFLFYFFIPSSGRTQAPPFIQIENSRPENLRSLNSYQNDYSPQISPNGRYLIFQSDRPGFLEQHSLWVSENLNFKKPTAKANWREPVPLRFLLVGSSAQNAPMLDASQQSEDQFFSVNSDNFEGAIGLVYRNQFPVELYFTSLRKQNLGRDGLSGLNIYHTYFQDRNWTNPQHLNIVNSEFNDRMPTLANDASTLIFSSNRPGGYGGYDLWLSIRNPKTKNWGTPVNAGNGVNTAYHESSPSLSPDGKLLFFSSDRTGGIGHYDIYISRNANGKWTRPSNLGMPFNSRWDDEYFSTSHDGLWAYFVSDRKIPRPKRKDGFDIYRIRLPQKFYHSVKVLFTGQVIDSSSQERLGVEAAIHIFFEKETRLITSQVFKKKAKETNNFSTYLESGRAYRVRFSAPGFYPKEIELDYRGNLPPGQVDRHIIALKRILQRESSKQSDMECIENEISCLDKIIIYFESDKKSILKSELTKLEQVMKILKANPSLRLDIAGHTDSTNTLEYNQKLSEDRAEVVRQWLVKMGIEMKRLEIKGYSFLKLKVKESSEKDRKYNRRVEFIRFTKDSEKSVEKPTRNKVAPSVDR